MLPTENTDKYFLTAGETDAQGRMPIWLIVSRIIEAATNHANILGLGYDNLIKHGIGWVLTRLSIEMDRYPGINENYSVTTWIEGYNRLYSDRCFAICDSEGRVVGNARSMWVAIDMEKRTAADLTALNIDKFVMSERRSPVGRQSKQRPLPDDAATEMYTFRFCDLDFNRHVNTVQYVRHVLNQWPLEQYDTHMVHRFDIQFHHECRYGETVAIRHADNADGKSLCDITDPQGRQAVAAAIVWRRVGGL